MPQSSIPIIQCEESFLVCTPDIYAIAVGIRIPYYIVCTYNTGFKEKANVQFIYCIYAPLLLIPLAITTTRKNFSIVVEQKDTTRYPTKFYSNTIVLTFITACISYFRFWERKKMVGLYLLMLSKNFFYIPLVKMTNTKLLRYKL